MHICIISEGYPYKDFAFFTFVKQIAEAMADQGHKVSVISPQSITKHIIRNSPERPLKYTEKTSSGSVIDIYSPKIVTVGNLVYKSRFIDSIFLKYIQTIISKTLDSFELKPDVIYGHFWHSAYYGFDYAFKHNISLFVASGEAEIEIHQRIKDEKLKRFADYVSGVICVSSKNKNESISLKLADENRCVVIPNAINSNVFFKKNKQELRRRFGFPEDKFILAFVGGFIPRKGPLKIVKALENLHDDEIKSIFIGSLLDKDISNRPDSEYNLFMGSLEHDQIPDYLNCADVFVLPTLKEGCCNSIIEALACGLPVISSDRDFNYDILDSNCSFMIDPDNVEAIADAIRTLKADKTLQERMSKSALDKAHDLEINTRATKIIKFIHSRLGSLSC